MIYHYPNCQKIIPWINYFKFQIKNNHDKNKTYIKMKMKINLIQHKKLNKIKLKNNQIIKKH